MIIGAPRLLRCWKDKLHVAGIHLACFACQCLRPNQVKLALLQLTHLQLLRVAEISPLNVNKISYTFAPHCHLHLYLLLLIKETEQGLRHTLCTVSNDHKKKYTCFQTCKGVTPLHSELTGTCLCTKKSKIIL